MNLLKILTLFLSLALFPYSFLQAQVVDRVVAVLDGEAITLYELKQSMKKNQALLESGVLPPEASTPEGKEKFALKHLIEEKLLDREIKKFGIEASETDLAMAIKNLSERNQLSEAELKKELAKEGKTWEEYREQLREQIKRIRFMNQVLASRIQVTDDDLEEFFARNPQQFGAYQTVEIAQIILPLDPNASSEEVEKVREQALKLRKQVKGSAKKFTTLGKKYSHPPQVAEVQSYALKDLSGPLQQGLINLKPGDVTEPLRTPLGFHLIMKVSASTLEGEEFRTIRAQFRQKLLEQKMDAKLVEYIEELKEKSYIELKL
ncbi:MAG: SurA N-terminal domain-containing protein [Deltaproteobacteria bacterium]|nr:SurA N-terminal domain-containing protein [Deltaproteobacteria bacterium]